MLNESVYSLPLWVSSRICASRIGPLPFGLSALVWWVPSHTCFPSSWCGVNRDRGYVVYLTHICASFASHTYPFYVRMCVPYIFRPCATYIFRHCVILDHVSYLLLVSYLSDQPRVALQFSVPSSSFLDDWPGYTVSFGHLFIDKTDRSGGYFHLSLIWTRFYLHLCVY